MNKLNEKLLSWASLLEDSTREQAERTAALPWVTPHLALMPDAHFGLGSTVGLGDPDRGCGHARRATGR